MVLFDDERIQNIFVADTEEPFADLRGFHGRIQVDESMAQIASRSEFFCFCRAGVAEKLAESTAFLPRNLSYCVKEAYRPLSIQRRSVNSVLNRYEKQYPDLSRDALLRKVYAYVAPESVAPHPTGGALDLTLVDENGTELPMGTVFNADPAAVQNKTYTETPLITGEEKRNREILGYALEKAGFVNYPSEWWHWSYGDRYWGFVKNTPALYPQIEETGIYKK
ncbi:M15 family metallopeptidase [Breznakiella homolactica]|uniref:D-alanyl-D-alanine dipeptidase n=1 Tax=Breznakiella homolactica TaxID=2798577 RepID=A0A7T8B7C9_9SPIR|nr:M15 family metallopeptidase [Breznakiella homolactica]QQO07384.1 M15 family metallopeptidase [Breznakiella homolactica]